MRPDDATELKHTESFTEPESPDCADVTESGTDSTPTSVESVITDAIADHAGGSNGAPIGAVIETAIDRAEQRPTIVLERLIDLIEQGYVYGPSDVRLKRTVVETDGAGAFLADEGPHFCDGCQTIHGSIESLDDHDCELHANAAVAMDIRPSSVAVSVAGPDPDAFAAYRQARGNGGGE